MNDKNSIHNSDLIEILGSFSNKDLKKFYQYLESPFFDVKPFTIPLFKIITSKHPLYDEKNLDKKNLFEKAYPKKKYNDEILRKGLSLLTQYLYDFTAIRYLKGNEEFYFTSKIKAISKTKFKSHIQKFENKFEKEILKDGINIDTFFHLSTLTGIYKSYTINTQSARKSVPKVFKEIDEFLIYFLFKFAVNRIEYKTISSYFNQDNPNSIASSLIRNINWEKFLEELHTRNKDKVFMREIVYHLHKLILSKDKNSIIEYYDFVSNSFDKFDINTRYYLYFPAVFQTSFVKFNSSLEFVELRHKLHKAYFSTENHYDKENHVMPIHEFLPLIADAFTLSDFKFAELVKEKYLNKIHFTIREDAGIYFDANYYYRKGKYKEALNYLSKLSSNEETFITESRYLKLLCYYELDYVEDALSYLSTIKAFTSLSKNYPGVNRPRANQFFPYFRELLVKKYNYTSDDWKFMLKKINKSKNFTHSPWILQKIEERIHASKSKPKH